MDINYVTAQRTNGANPFQIFASLKEIDSDALAFALKAMSYSQFLKTAYWFAVSQTAKSRAGMRCQVCNQETGIQVHHRTYLHHGYEHEHMNDLVVLCSDCHGLFHGHKEKKPEISAVERNPVRPGKRDEFFPPQKVIAIPEGDSFILTLKMINDTRTNGSFTSVTLNALGAPTRPTSGWVKRLVGTRITRENYIAAVDGIGRCKQKRIKFERPQPTMTTPTQHHEN